MTPSELRARTKRFAIRVVAYCRRLPNDWTIRVLAGQLLRSGTAVGANDRSACRGRSNREFCAKIGVVADEADETLFWLELLAETSPLTRSREHQHLFEEADQLTAIFTASHHPAKTNLANRKRIRSPNH